MDNNRIINCSEEINENDVCAINNLRSYHMLGNELNEKSKNKCCCRWHGFK